MQSSQVRGNPSIHRQTSGCNFWVAGKRPCDFNICSNRCCPALPPFPLLDAKVVEKTKSYASLLGYDVYFFIMPPRKTPLQQRIEKHIISKNNCWITDILCTHDGRPRMWVDGKLKFVSRLIFELYNTKIPDGYFVCHNCDNPACVNPEHLFLGTLKDNSADMVKKDRQAKGSKHGFSKLNDEQVLTIKQLLNETKLTQKAIAELFNVSRQTIVLIALNRQWKHIVYQPKTDQLSLFEVDDLVRQQRSEELDTH